MIPKLFIAADDFTGALDTGVQFAKEGVSTRVFCSGEAVFKGVEVVVVNTESRHLPAKAAEEKVRALTEIAKRAGVKYFYKKTDSALRGNVGAELTGMLHASGESALAFIPAYPALNRITERGVHYIDGVPAAESVFAKDPFEPVRESEVKALIRRQSGEKVYAEKAGTCLGDKRGIVVFDAVTQSDLLKSARRLRESGARVFAGSAGFASCLGSIIEFNKTAPKSPEPIVGLVVVTGSVNPVTSRQMEYAKSEGFAVLTLSERQKLDGAYSASSDFRAFFEEINNECLKKGLVGIRAAAAPEDFIADGFGDVKDTRTVIAGNIGAIAARLIRGLDAGVFIIGGDVLQSTLAKLEVASVLPVCEPQPGTVLFEIEVDGKRKTLFSKSGGFGKRDAVMNIYQYVRRAYS